MTHDRETAAPSDDHDQIVAAAGRGDERAWRQLVHRYKRLVYSIPREYRLPDDICEDVFQTVFTALVRELPKIADPRALPKWLITTTTRECWKASRTRRQGQLPADVPAQAPDAGEIADWESQAALDRALLELGGRCERLLRFMYLMPNQIPYETVAETLGMPIGSVGPTRARCLAKLADLLNENSGYEAPPRPRGAPR